MAGFTRLSDGTIVSGNIPTQSRNDLFNLQNLRDHGTYKAIVLQTHYVDSDGNKSKIGVEYRIRLVDGEKAGYEYDNCRAFDGFGGVTNFGEVVYQAKTNKVGGLSVGSSTEGEPPENYDNTYVLVTFLGGYRVPVILCPWSHPINKVPSAKEEDGVRLLKEFNGVRWEINKDGELIITYLGGVRTPPPTLGLDPTGLLFPTAERSDTAPTQIKIDQQGNLRIIDNECNELKISRENKLISLTQYLGNLLPELPLDYQKGHKAELLPVNFPLNEIKLDKENKKISVTNYEVGGVEKLKIDLDGSAGEIKLQDALTQVTTTIGNGKASIETATSTVTVDGAADETTIQAKIGDKIVVSGPNGILAQASTKATLKLARGKVGLGGPAGELVEEFEKLLTQMDTLLTQMATETHIGNLGFPTGPPMNAAAYAAVQAQIAAIKVIIGLLKGGI